MTAYLRGFLALRVRRIWLLCWLFLVATACLLGLSDSFLDTHFQAAIAAINRLVTLAATVVLLSKSTRLDALSTGGRK